MIPEPLNRLIAKVIGFTHRSYVIGIDRPNTVCQFRYYKDTDGTVYVVYFYNDVPVAFARNNMIVDFAAILLVTKDTYKRYLPMLKLKGGQPITVKYTVDRDFHIHRREI